MKKIFFSQCFLSTILFTMYRTSCLVFPCPILHAFIKKLANSFSSSLVRNELGPGFVLCFTFPDIRIPCSSAALFTPISPNLTASIAAIMALSSHNFCFFFRVTYATVTITQLFPSCLPTLFSSITSSSCLGHHHAVVPQIHNGKFRLFKYFPHT